MRNRLLSVLCVCLALVLIGMIGFAWSMGRIQGGIPLGTTPAVIGTSAVPITGGTTMTTAVTETQTPTTTEETPLDTQFVPVSQYLPDVFVDLKYATTDNFTGQSIYTFSDAYLRYGTVRKLQEVQNQLKAQGLSLKIWDAFRPPTAQFRLWEICPDPTYVADPNLGFSSHSRGNTVDITLVDALGKELVMPTGFDDFSARADRDYSDCSPEAAANAWLLEQIMAEAGFRGYVGEWWHYTDQDSYEVETVFIPQ